MWFRPVGFAVPSLVAVLLCVGSARAAEDGTAAGGVMAASASSASRPTGSAPAAAASQPQTRSPVVATFMGREIRMAAIDFSEQEKAQVLKKMDAAAAQDYFKRHRLSELERKIVVPLRERYIRENHLEPTKKELAAATEAFRVRQKALRLRQDEERRKLEAQISSGELNDADRTQAERRLAEINRSARMEAEADKRRAESIKDMERLEVRRKEVQIQLESRELSPKDRDRLSDELGRLDQAISLTSRLCKDTPESLADMMVASWKFQKSLYERFGGEVIYQQLGIEAVGAMRKWLEEHEAAGDFTIVDPQLRKDFWDYYTRKDHPAKAGEPDPFRTPPWLEESPDTSPAER